MKITLPCVTPERERATRSIEFSYNPSMDHDGNGWVNIMVTIGKTEYHLPVHVREFLQTMQKVVGETEAEKCSAHSETYKRLYKENCELRQKAHR